MDAMPSSHAIRVDFFPAPFTGKPLDRALQQRYYDAYNRGIRSNRITAAELDDAVGNGPKLTVLVQRIDPTLPPIETSYDLMKPEPEDDDEEC
jgi:hypothetical protein